MATDLDFGPGQALLQPYDPAGSNGFGTNFMAAYDADGRLLWAREPTVGASGPVTIAADGGLYYLNASASALIDYDPGPGNDSIQPANLDCIITKYVP
jgi:hypothetical protein